MGNRRLIRPNPLGTDFFANAVKSVFSQSNGEQTQFFAAAQKNLMKQIPRIWKS